MTADIRDNLMKDAVQTAERPQLTKGCAKLQNFARALKESVPNAKRAVDGKRMQALAEILQRLTQWAVKCKNNLKNYAAHCEPVLKKT
jgi:hypothetical protein